ncbi:hypothetical protein [Streptosporangium sp. NPDC004631]
MARLLDRMLDSLLPGETAGACVAPDCQWLSYEWGGRVGVLWCCYRCNGSIYCP